jgi:hypothetical protein
MAEATFRASTTTDSMFGDERDVERQPEGDGIPARNDLPDAQPITDFEPEVLGALNIADELDNLPTEDRQNLKEVSNYVSELLKTKGLQPTRKSFETVMADLKDEMGLDSETEPGIALDRIAGVVKAWRELSFIKDPREKRSILMRLARLDSSKEMNRAMLSLMNDHQIWL